MKRRELEKILNKQGFNKFRIRINIIYKDNTTQLLESELLLKKKIKDIDEMQCCAIALETILKFADKHNIDIYEIYDYSTELQQLKGGDAID